MCNEVNEYLFLIFKKHVGIDFEEKKSLRNENLFSRIIGADPCEMAVLLLEVEKHFNIRIEDEAIVNGELDSFEKIRKCVDCMI